jgi:hypothetical protein
LEELMWVDFSNWIKAFEGFVFASEFI